jgi:hypothetical protein
MTDRRAAWTAGLLVLAFLLAVNTPYAALVALFGYDDVLRLPPGTILLQFRERQALLAWIWFAFAAAALAFAPVAAAVDRALGQAPGLAGQASAIAQFIGLLRWAMVVPLLAEQAAESPQAAMAEAMFVVLHQVLGVMVGEILGQVLLVAWTLRVARRLRALGYPRLALAGMATIPLWLAGLTEPLATGLRGLPVIEATPLAFLAWQAWLAALAAILLSQAWSQPAFGAPAASQASTASSASP